MKKSPVWSSVLRKTEDVTEDLSVKKQAQTPAPALVFEIITDQISMLPVKTFSLFI
jgi:hypothetical protein